MTESAKFFEHGRVELLETDVKSREARIRVCLPCCLFLAVTPSLLGAGLVDGFRLRHPVAVWIPKLTGDRFHPAVLDEVPLAAEKANAVLKQAVEKVLENFQDLLQIMPFPDDLIPTLPLGVYVEFEYRCRLDDMAKMLVGVGSTVHHGMDEFRYAVATVLNTALQDAERWESRRLTAGRP